ncbi:MAG: DUF1016 N-terminal domain-containing protein [Bacteroidales bacterium]|jgi:hypothetical protein|nr:DUF1016 N-terminal domain-containing protein [Bacteroidales bacterium]
MGIAKIKENSEQLLVGIEQLIEQTGRQVAVYLNTRISRLYWAIGNYIVPEIQYETYSDYGQQIIATLSQRLTEKFGKGYSYSAITLTALPDKQWFIDKLNKSIAIAQQNVVAGEEKELAGKALKILKDKINKKFKLWQK